MTKFGRGGWAVALVSLLALGGVAGCADPGGGGIPRPDSGPHVADAGLHDAATDAGPTCMTNADCIDDHLFCNGVLQCMGGRCISANIPSCNDSVSCTDDSCDGTLDRCLHTVNDANCSGGLHCATTGCQTNIPCEHDGECDDHVFCNGVESCAGGSCTSAGMRDCDDTSSCTMDACDATAGMCTHTAFADAMTNVAHCGDGLTCVACPMPAAALHQVASCMVGLCGVVCEMGYHDSDGDPSNGCEFACTPMGTGVDVPDDGFLDQNCDGIDGDRTLAIFVSTSGSAGNDGLTPATAVGSLSAAFAVFAAHSTRTQILVQNGTYATNTPLAIPSGVGIYGGYTTSTFTTRTDSRAQVTTSGNTAAIADHLSAPTVIDRVSLTTMNQSMTSGATTTLVVIGSSDNLTLRFMGIIAGRGGDGSNGAAGGTGAVGGRGSDGSGQSGGGGGSPNGGVGGNGASGGSSGMGGGNGVGACGGAGGAAGSGGTGCGDGDPGGGNGGSTTTCSGGPGGSGAGGNGLGTLTGSTWTAATAGAGGTGTVGGGGGGGGGGAGEHCNAVLTCYCDNGRGGGGGGGGGAGGAGGHGGVGGGASIGIVLIGSTLNVMTVRVTTSSGGNGGSGGGGGGGGSGGGGGAGIMRSNSSQGPGGNGSMGSSGGTGGCGGGGGGGPSVGIWGNGAASAQINELSPTTFVIGSGGTGGTSCGTSGASGSTANLQGAVTL